MLYCKPIHATPCHRYDKRKPDELIAFLTANESTLAHIEKDGTAHVVSFVKGERRFVYLKPGCWIRATGVCQFSVCTDGFFRDTYALEQAEANEPITKEEFKSLFSDTADITDKVVMGVDLASGPDTTVTISVENGVVKNMSAKNADVFTSILNKLRKKSGEVKK